MKLKTLLISFLLIIGVAFAYSQEKKNDKGIKIEQKLSALSVNVPALDNTVDISVNTVSIQDFVRAVAQNAGVNINIDPNLKLNVSSDFTKVKVKDILLFLCNEYNLDFEVIGNIISLKKVEEPVELKKIIPLGKIPKVDYEKNSDLLSLDAYNDTLRAVTKALVDKTGKNVVLAPGLSGTIVSAYIQKMPFESVLDKFTYANNLTVEKTGDNYYLIKKAEESAVGSVKNKQKGGKKNDDGTGDFDYKIRGNIISIHAEKANIYDLVKTISDKLKINYMLLSDIQGTTTIHADSLDYDHFLVKILDGTNYTFLKQANIYLIGETKNTSLSSSEIYYLQFRSADKIKDYIPADLTRDVKIIEFLENNSLIMTGNMISITKLKDFIRQVDKIVPVVLIEVTILDVSDSYSFSTGLQAGLSDGTTNVVPTTSTGILSPGVDMTLSTSAINKVVDGINGLGLIKLGNVSSNFYTKIKLMEDNNVAKVKSTPMLSTMNGHEATLTSGETRYYKEERSDYIGTQTPSLANSYTWKPLTADLTINIKPIVSGDGQITLDIQVQQSEFTTKAAADGDAPYNSVKRDFKSSIRMKDSEVILLGGLEKNTSENSGTGLPLLSRIPVLKWFFSSRTKSKANSKLNIFIKPTVIY
jgi:type IV pilus assembly protein PilQ